VIGLEKGIILAHCNALLSLYLARQARLSLRKMLSHLPGTQAYRTMMIVTQFKDTPMAHVLIEAAALADWMAGDDAAGLLDARTRLADPNAGTALWHEAHIPGAQRADLDQDLSAPPSREGGRHPLPTQSDFTQRLQHWGITPQQRVVIYDDMGGCLS